jgi:L-fucose isomerase-like protein
MSIGIRHPRDDVRQFTSPHGPHRPTKSASCAALGVIIGNREFFPDQLVAEAREDIVQLFSDCGVRPLMLTPKETKLGGVETHDDARKCADLFKRHRDEIDGLLVVLPNFGDEKAVTETVKLSGLNVPILVQAYPDNLNQLGVARRRDSFCGKISVCNNLVQSGIRFTLPQQHVTAPCRPAFEPMSRRKRRAWRSARRGRRAARSVQHGALQREDSGTQRH